MITDNKMEIKDMVSSINSCYMDLPFVFVSYSKADAERVYPFILKLQKLRCNLWIDKELSRMVGKNWQFGAVEAMTNKNCKGILFMISENSLKSAPVLAELSLSQSSKKVLRRHDGSGIKLIPINADASWSQSKLGLATWIASHVSTDTTAVTEDDRTCMDVGGLLTEYIAPDSINRIDEKGEIAQVIFDDILKPLGGGKITVASIEDLETVKENIDDSCFCLTDEQMIQSAPVSSAPEDTEEGVQKSAVLRHVYPNGDVYEGEMKNGLRDGRGKCSYKSGSVYEGEFKDDKRHGKGICRFANGVVYEGEYRDNERDGFGKYTYPNGDVYMGSVKKGKRHGHGKFIFADGKVRECEWRDNLPVQPL